MSLSSPSPLSPRRNESSKVWLSSRTSQLLLCVNTLLLLAILVTLRSEANFTKHYQADVIASRRVTHQDDERSLRQSQKEDSVVPLPPTRPLDTTQISPPPLHPSTRTTTTTTTREPPVHMLYSLCGDHEGFMAEFAVSLKSILLNAPHHRDMHIHIMADQAAYNCLPHVWNETQIAGIPWWTNITIKAYNVESFLEKWDLQIQQGTNNIRSKNSIHTFGTYFRLFANQVLPKEVQYALYIDTDVVALANLAPVFRYAPAAEKAAPLFIMAKGCAGVMLVNVQKLDTFWEYMHQIEWDKTMLRHNDQSMVMGVGEKFPGTVLTLPDPYEITLSEHVGRARAPQKYLKYRPEAALFHYNGGGGAQDTAFGSDYWNKYLNGIGLPAVFYRELPWTWARYMGKSAADGVNAKVQIVAANGGASDAKHSDNPVAASSK